ncbi:hypothetical protein ACLB2K_030392 [Fragaria x ananassa]
MSSKEGEVVVFDLPEDIVLNILCRLPVKSLIRFTCFSKRWRSIIISDSQFARTTFQLASQNRTLRQRLLLCTNPDHEDNGPPRFQCLGNLRVPRFGGNSMVQSLSLTPEVETARVMLASCNGLVVLGQRLRSFFTNLSLWNPSTGFHRKIPSPVFSMKEGTNSSSVAYGFGHVMATDEYKLVFFELLDLAVHIFSTRDMSWKVIRAPHSSFPGYGMSIFTPRSSFPEYNGVPLLVSNGACHWVRNWVPEPAIYAFDLAEEEFSKLSLPLALMPELPNGLYVRQIYTQVLREGCLCVWTWNCYGYAEFWEMKEYGVPESWVKLFHFSVRDLPDIFVSTIGWTPVLVTEGGTVVFDLYDKKFYGDRELVRVKCHREDKPVCSGRCKIEGAIEGLAEYAVMVYDETLLSV